MTMSRLLKPGIHPPVTATTCACSCAKCTPTTRRVTSWTALNLATGGDTWQRKGGAIGIMAVRCEQKKREGRALRRAALGKQRPAGGWVVCERGTEGGARGAEEERPRNATRGRVKKGQCRPRLRYDTITRNSDRLPIHFGLTPPEHTTTEENLMFVFINAVASGGD